MILLYGITPMVVALLFFVIAQFALVLYLAADRSIKEGGMDK